METTKVLRDRLVQVASDSGMAYRDVIRAFKWAETLLMDKADNLIDSTNIQEVLKEPSRYDLN